MHVHISNKAIIAPIVPTLAIVNLLALTVQINNNDVKYSDYHHYYTEISTIDIAEFAIPITNIIDHCHS